MQDSFIEQLSREFTQDFSATEIPLSEDMMRGDEFAYVRVEEVARGGSKIIYRAVDNVCRRVVAMAVPREASSERINRDFLREAYICSYVQHPNIIPVYHIGKSEGGVFYTMKLIEGESLGDIIKGLSDGDERYVDEYDQARMLEVFVNVVSAIAYAHSKGIVHLDLKPENIQISKYGEVLICDWGLARILEARCDESLLERVEFAPELKLESVGIRGTPGYMSPEQTKLTGVMDEKSDIYSLGAILYCMLTLRPPVDESEASENMRKTRLGEWNPPSEVVNKHIPLSVEAVVKKCLERDPEERYDSAVEIIDDVRRCIRGYASQAEQAGVWRQIQLFYLRNKKFCISAVSSIILIGGIVAFFMVALKLEKDKAQTAQLVAEKQSLELIREKKERERVSKMAATRKYTEGMDYSMGHENFEKAYAAFEQCVLLDSDHEEAWQRKGCIELGNLDLEQALESFSHITNPSLVNAVQISVVKSYYEKFKKQKPDNDDIVRFATELEKVRLNFACRAVYLKVLAKDLTLSKRIEYLKDLIIAINQLNSNQGEQVRFDIDNREVSLDVSGIKKLRYLPSLKKLPIYSLNLSGTNITDTLILRNTPLRILNLSDTWLSRVSGCEDLPLEELHLSVNSLKEANRLVRIKTLRKLYIPEGTREYFRERRIIVPDKIEIIEQ